MPLHPLAVQALEEPRKEPMIDQKVFPVRRSTRPGPWISRVFADLCIKAGLTREVERDGGRVAKNRGTLHDLCRKANTHLRNGGASAKERTSLMGHRTTAVNEGYYKADLPDRQRALIDAFTAFGRVG